MQAHGTLEFSGGGGIPGPGTIPLTSLAPQAANTVVANNTGGAASPTAVPYASMPWVLKAGDTMTGPLLVNSGALAGVVATQTTSGLLQNDSAVVVRSTDAGALGPTLALFHDSASPAPNDSARLRAFFNNSAAAAVLGNAINFRLTNATAGAEATQTEIGARTAGVHATQLTVANGVFTPNAAGTAMGADTINAIALYENGVSIASKYVDVAGDTMTGALSIVVPVGNNLNLWSRPAGSTAGLYYQTSGSFRWSFAVNNAAESGGDAGSNLVFSRFSDAGAFIDDPITITRANGAVTLKGLATATATGGYQGAGTVNATALYANANLVADTNGLLRTRPYTVGTLPAAAGVAGALARVSDALAAPVYNAAAAGGGTVFANVCSNGTTWLYC